MTVHISNELEEALRQIAAAQGRQADAVVADAVRDYLVAASITDVTPAELAETQMKLLTQFPSLAPYENGADDHEAR